MVVLQTLPFPTVGLCTELGLYVKVHDGAWYSHEERAVVFQFGGLVATDTYFGVLPTAKWARHTTIRHVEVVLDVCGDIEVEAVQNRPHYTPLVVATGRLDGDGDLVLTLPDIAELDEGHVFLRVRGRRDGSLLRGVTVRSVDPPDRDVRLGLAVTTFNRQDYVRRNVARLDAYVADRSDLRSALRLVVVDNGRNLDLPPTSALTSQVVPNRNLGGAGGFARGLMEHRDGGWATHVLFMDDDITFEPEIVSRMRALFAYAVDPALCIAGGMLLEEKPSVQFEAGANVRPRSTDIWQALASRRDLTTVDALLGNDIDVPIDYGGWWCFGFPIDLTADYPAPVFIRGDDVCFGLQYTRGHVVTFNGIGVWHQDFAYKNTPVAFFYESRNLPIMLSVTHPDVYDAGVLRKRLLERAARFTTAFKYDSAHAVIDGIDAFLDGPDALLARGADELNDELRQRYGERLGPLTPDQVHAPAWTPPPSILPMLWRAASLATIGGHLLPRRLRRGRTWAVRAENQPVMATIGAEAIVFRHDPSGTGYLAPRDREEFRRIVRRARAVSARISEEFDTAAEAWRAAYPKLVSEEYWRGQFNVSTGTARSA